MSENVFSAQELISIEKDLTEVMKRLFAIRQTECPDWQIARDIAIAHTNVQTAVAFFRAFIVPFAEEEAALSDK